MANVNQGDIVRFELEDETNSGTWFYCRVGRVLEDGELECDIVDAQSWPHLAMAGLLPGRTVRIASERVLSVVHASH
jgi:hypothetical protein